MSPIVKSSTALLLLLGCIRLSAQSAPLLDEATTFALMSDGATTWSSQIRGRVSDNHGHPLAKASVVIDGREWKTDESGDFRISLSSSKSPLLIKKPGYRKIQISPRSGDLEIRLESLEIKSLYMQSGMMKRNVPAYVNAFELLKNTELNALTIDVKDDEGNVSKGLKPYISNIQARGIYTIARIVAFKDNVAPRRNPKMALLDTRTGAPWKDRNGVTYLDPYNSAAHDYLIQIAKQAALDGFDEIQFDYVRFPTDGNRAVIAWPANFDSNSRSTAIAQFLAKARKELGAMGAFVAADVFGITAYDRNDSGIGQRVEDITPFLDYVCPMVYPSGFAMKTGSIVDPVNHPKEIVEDSVRRYRLRADKDSVIRPWLQAFRDYAYNRRDYQGPEIRAQIDGAKNAGGIGFLLWNAASRYSSQGLKKKDLSSKMQNQVKPGNLP